MKTKPSKIKAALLDWLGIPISLTNEQFWSSISLTEAGQAINDATILKLSSVWACARIISETISTLPLHVYEKTPDGRIQNDSTEVASLLKQPNSTSTSAVFWEAMLASMLLRGNGLAEKKYIGNRITSLEFLSPARTIITRDTAGNRIYSYVEKDSTQRIIPENKIFRIPGFTIDGDWGLSVVEYGSSVFGAALAAGNAANTTFENGLHPTVAFKLDRVLTTSQREEFRTSLLALSGALNAGKAPLLEAGMDVTTIGINPNDAQLLESRNFSVEEICRWFRVPPHMVGHTSNSTSWGSGIEQQMIGFLTFTLRPWLTRIEQAISKELMNPTDRLRYYAEFSIEGLLRADSTARGNYLSQMVNNGIMTRDEAREKENLKPMGGNSAVLMTQTAMSPIDMLGVQNG